MGLLSIFKRRADASTHAAPLNDASNAVQKARTRARQRLIGAVVLVGIGVIGFPIIFETQPRPIPIDVPIELPRKDGMPPLVVPPARAASPVARAPSRPAAPASAAAPRAVLPDAIVNESAEDAGREVAKSQPASAAGSPSTPRAASSPAPRPVIEPPARPVAELKPAAPATESARAKALLDGKPAAATESGRFVVQVGAFADADAARETRAKVEKLGLKTYTQVASTASGNRIRVRVGPFTTRDDAEKALARARGAGLTAVVLTL